MLTAMRCTCQTANCTGRGCLFDGDPTLVPNFYTEEPPMFKPGMPNAEKYPATPVLPTQLDRIEAKLDALLEALAEDPDEEPEGNTLDGQPSGRERDQSQSLG